MKHKDPAVERGRLYRKKYDQKMAKAVKALEEALKLKLNLLGVDQTDKVHVRDLPMQIVTDDQGISTVDFSHTQYAIEGDIMLRFRFYGIVMDFGYQILEGDDAKFETGGDSKESPDFNPDGPSRIIVP